MKSCGQFMTTAVDWTIVRAPMLTNGASKKAASKIGALGSSGGTVSRASIASFILDELEKGNYIHQSPLVSD